jgi:hypothetical protein
MAKSDNQNGKNDSRSGYGAGATQWYSRSWPSFFWRMGHEKKVRSPTAEVAVTAFAP